MVAAADLPVAPGRRRRIAIVGAGFAGIASAKVLTQFGHDVTVFEKAPDLGGVWSRTRRYPGLSTQNNKGTYHLSDLPMPRDYPEWPAGEQVQAYLESYARMFNLTDLIRTSTTVTSADLDENADTGRWNVTVEGPDGQRSEVFDELVVANGIFSTPFVPTFPGREEFEAAGGRVCTPSDVRGLEEVRRRNVLVVGYGKSACDIATAVCDEARSTTVVARQLIWKMPKKVGNVLNFKYLMLTRLGEALFEYETLRGVERFLHGPGTRVRDGLLGGIQRVATKQLALNDIGLVPDGSFARIARSTVSLTTDGFFEKARSGALEVVRDARIVRLFSDGGVPHAELSTGAIVPADVVICATGWHQGVPFLSEQLQRRITDDRGNFELYRFILPHDVPGLWFTGYNSSFFSPLSAEVAALWVADQLMGGTRLPSVEERRRRVAERVRWMEERTEGHHARGTNIIPFSMHNIEEIITEMGLRAPRGQRIREWVLPIDPSQYRYVTTELLKRKAGIPS